MYTTKPSTTKTSIITKLNAHKVVDTVPVLAVPASMYHTDTYTSIEMPMFCTSLNTKHTGHVLGVQANFGCTSQYKKKSFFFFFSFEILEFL